MDQCFQKESTSSSSSKERNGRMAPTNIVSLDYTWHKILVNLPSYEDWSSLHKEFTVYEVE